MESSNTIFVRCSEWHYKISGDWRQYCLSRRRLYEGTGIKIGAPKVGYSLCLNLMFGKNILTSFVYFLRLF